VTRLDERDRTSSDCRTFAVCRDAASTRLGRGTSPAAQGGMSPTAAPDPVVQPSPSESQRLIALEFASAPQAHHALHAAWRLHEQNRLAVHDAVVVSAEHGEAEVVESLDPTPIAAAVPSSLLGALAGSVLAGPLGFLIGGVIAGATGALVTRFVDTGIPHRLVARLRQRTKPGQAVVALLVSDEEAAIAQLRGLPGAHVVYDHR
jgi:uncharacterized membrane protein